MSRDWASGLPGEVLSTIAQRLPVPDFLRLRSVCTSWASSLSNNRLTPTPSHHFPWLGFVCSSLDQVPSFLDNNSNHQYHLPITSSWIGSRDGWLVTIQHNSQVQLINPITGARVNLPPLAQQSNIQKVVLSPITCVTFDITAVVIHSHAPGELSFARPGERGWKPVLVPDVLDVVYHQGQFVAVSRQGQQHTFSLNGSVMTTSAAAPASYSYYNKIYLVSASSGDLFQVVETKNESSDDEAFFQHCTVTLKELETYDTSFSIMKFSPELDSHWVEIEDLGDMSLFLDPFHSVLMSAKDVPGLRPNCIYFAALGSQTSGMTVMFFVNDVGVFDIKTGVIEMYTSKCRRCLGRSTPKFAPIWFMPSLL